MARVISIVNQKGGVGKTTTAINLGAYLAFLGKIVLLIDVDPQANASSGIGVDWRNLERGVYEALVSPTPFREVIIHTKRQRYHLAPATLNLAGANIELVNIPKREHRLWEEIQSVRNSFDYIIIDCPPSLGLLTINGIVAADSLLIPVQCEYYALEGLSQLLRTINLIKENLRPEIDIIGALMTMYNDKNRLNKEVFEELYRYFPNKIFRTIIPQHPKLAEAPSHGQTILEYDSRSPGAKAYERLAKELITLS